MPIRFLLVCTAWGSSDGGIQTVNRRLAQALASQGQLVVAAVPSSSSTERVAAAEMGVKLLDAGDAFVKLHKIVADEHTDVVCGHSTFTGGIEEAIKEAHPRVRIVHFVHHDPEVLEALKEYRDEREKEREARTRREVEFAANADIVVAVGANLRDKYVSRIDAFADSNGPQVMSLDLGVDSLKVGRLVVSTSPEVHLVGRSDSIAVKGMDIFARAAAKLSQVCRKDRDGTTPTFVVRGGRGDLDAIANQLREVGRRVDPQFDIQVREFSTDEAREAQTWRLARLLVMPSRAEGYGLVALEALSHGVPAIVSSRSGVYRLLDELLPVAATARRRFLWTYDEFDSGVDALAAQMYELIVDQETARTLALETRNALLPIAGWEVAARGLIEICTELLRRPRSEAGGGIAVLLSDPTPSVLSQNRADIEKLLDSPRDSPGVQVFGGRGEDYVRIYRALIERLDSNLDIMGLCLSKFRRDYGRQLASMSERARIRIALLDPAFPLPRSEASIASIREREENRDDGEFRRKIAAYYTQVLAPYLQNAVDRHGDGGLQIRLYRSLPATNIFRVDDVLFFGPYLLAAAEQETPTMMIRRRGEMGGALFSVLMRHYEEVWSTESRYRLLQDIPQDELRAWQEGEVFA